MAKGMKPIAIGLDIGGGSAKIGLVSADGAVLRRTSVMTRAATSPRTVAAVYANAVESLVLESGVSPVNAGVKVRQWPE